MYRNDSHLNTTTTEPKQKAQEPKLLSVVTSLFTGSLTESKAQLQWLALQLKYPCALCNKVLAAPVTLSCSHSLCGMCAPVPQPDESMNDLAICQCPVCAQTLMNEGNYCEMFDNMICGAAAEIGPCIGKREWTARRQKHLDERCGDKQRMLARKKLLKSVAVATAVFVGAKCCQQVFE